MDESSRQPLPPSTAEDVKEYVQLQQDSLLKALQPLQDRLGNAITAQTANLGHVQKSLRRVLQQRVRNQQNALEDIGNDIRGHLATLTDEQQVRLNHSILQLPSDSSRLRGSGLTCPPGQFLTGYIPASASSTGQDIPLCSKIPSLPVTPVSPLQPKPAITNGEILLCGGVPVHKGTYCIQATGPNTYCVVQVNSCDDLHKFGPNIACNLPTLDSVQAILPTVCPGCVQDSLCGIQELPIIGTPPPPPPPPPPEGCAPIYICNWPQFQFPGSSCDNPLYIVLCLPKKKGEVCPNPTVQPLNRLTLQQ